MAFSVIGNMVGGANYGTPVTATTINGVTAGHLLVAVAAANRTGGANTITVSDNVGGTWVAGTANIQGNNTVQFFYCFSAIGGNTAISAASTSAYVMRINVCEVHVDTTAELDAEAGADRGLNAYQTITTSSFTAAGGIIFAGIGSVTTDITQANTLINEVAPDAQFKNSINNLVLGYLVSAGFTNHNHFYLPSYSDWLFNIVSFKEAAGGLSIPVMLAGIGMSGGVADLMTGGITE